MMSTMMMIALLSIPAAMTLATLLRMAEPERVPVRVRAHRRPY
ncbi:MAG TPA: hypothetical protein PLK13_00095 [Xanthobacteraceae bacterium]|jgi:hypothetical protein|nr:hypothetical protein [Xanthobacteraceae bacterium]HQS45664.1 hypothetical protein [Xanthobacteraceae bacterium]